jgi:hypothetical protein
MIGGGNYAIPSGTLNPCREYCIFQTTNGAPYPVMMALCL